MRIPDYTSDVSVYFFMWYPKYFFLEGRKRNRFLKFQVGFTVEVKTYACYSGHDPRLRDCVRGGGGLGKVTAILGML